MTSPARRFAVLALMAMALLVACGRTPPPTGTAPTEAVGITVIPEAERQPAPRIAGDRLDGGSLALDPGKWTVVNAWASWCEPCRAETTELVAYARAHPQIRFIGIDVQDRTEAALAFAREHRVPYPSVADPDGRLLAQIPGVPPKALPSTIVIDPQGRIAARAVGPVTAESLDQMLADADAP